MSHLLIADDERTVVEGLALVLKDHPLKTAVTRKEATAFLKEEPFDLLICDLFFPELGDGLALIREARGLVPEAFIVVLTGHGSVETAVLALRAGADDYLEKTLPGGELKLKVGGYLRAARERKALKRYQALSEALAGPGSPFIGSSPAFLAALEKIKIAAGESRATVLILGETGTGKEAAARLIHAQSARKEAPFLALDCPSLPETLFESELFGYEQGAFTDARQRKLGKLELANEGTLFLDEIGDLLLSLQPKLLRFLETGEFFRLGGTQALRVATRIVASTNQDLPALIRAGRFREDLYYRLKVLVIEMPPLRDRVEDVPLLAEHFLKRFDPEQRKRHLLSERVLQVFGEHDWPGNVRELRNVVECLVLTEDEEDILKKLPRSTQGQEEKAPSQTPPGTLALSADNLPPNLPYREARAEGLKLFERSYFRRVLEEQHWNITRAAAKIGLSREELHRKLKHLAIKR